MYEHVLSSIYDMRIVVYQLLFIYCDIYACVHFYDMHVLRGSFT